MAGKTGTLSINLLIEAAADWELYGLLADVPARRRATLIRLWAKQGLVGGRPHQIYRFPCSARVANCAVKPRRSLAPRACTRR